MGAEQVRDYSPVQLHFMGTSDDVFMVDPNLGAQLHREQQILHERHEKIAFLARALEIAYERPIADGLKVKHPAGPFLLFDLEESMLLEALVNPETQKVRVQEVTNADRFTKTEKHKTYYGVLVVVPSQSAKEIASEVYDGIMELSHHIPKHNGSLWVLEPTSGEQVYKKYRKAVLAAAGVQTESDVETLDIDGSSFLLWEARHGKPTPRDILAQRYFLALYGEETDVSGDKTQRREKIDVESELEKIFLWFRRHGYTKIHTDALVKYLKGAAIFNAHGALQSLWEGARVTAFQECGCMVAIEKNGNPNRQCCPTHPDGERLPVPDVGGRANIVQVWAHTPADPALAHTPRLSSHHRTSREHVKDVEHAELMVDARTGEETWVMNGRAITNELPVGHNVTVYAHPGRYNGNGDRDSGFVRRHGLEIHPKTLRISDRKEKSGCREEFRLITIVRQDGKFMGVYSVTRIDPDDAVHTTERKVDLTGIVDKNSAKQFRARRKPATSA